MEVPSHYAPPSQRRMRPRPLLCGLMLALAFGLFAACGGNDAGAPSEGAAQQAEFDPDTVAGPPAPPDPDLEPEPVETPPQAAAEQEAASTAEGKPKGKSAQRRPKPVLAKPSGPVPRQFGAAVLAPPAPPGSSAAQREAAYPFDQVIPPLPPDPTVRIAVLSSHPRADIAERVALIIGEHAKSQLEAELGKAVKIAYISQLRDPVTDNSLIHFRKDFLSAAVKVAAVLPAEQLIEPMTVLEQLQAGVDVIVYVGADYR